jgi:GT2 family glycosyltransferase
VAKVSEAQFDVAVCVHNALDDVQHCLDSVVRHSPQCRSLILINDGSDEATSKWLDSFAVETSNCQLIRHKEALGYTAAANRALNASQAEYVVLLNSDTIVSRDWLIKLAECFASDEKIGIVGPLSNAASWQSVPYRFDDHGDWHLNPLPVGWDVDKMADLVASVSRRSFPKVPFVNGFCFAISRTVIEHIGAFDAKSFPQGYGEENDYCLRVANAGFRLAIADHTYVYHAKSKSFSHERRRLLSQQGGKMLQKKHGWFRMWRNVRRIKRNRTLLEIAEAIGDALQNVDHS